MASRHDDTSYDKCINAFWPFPSTPKICLPLWSRTARTFAVEKGTWTLYVNELLVKSRRDISNSEIYRTSNCKWWTATVCMQMQCRSEVRGSSSKKWSDRVASTSSYDTHRLFYTLSDVLSIATGTSSELYGVRRKFFGVEGTVLKHRCFPQPRFGWRTWRCTRPK